MSAIVQEEQISKFEATIVGESPEIRKVIEEARKIAQSSSLTVLIIGESGTGKELVARLIHNLSHYANQPFVDINCGAIPESLLESELFGYEKGAFTGAVARKQGLFELANGGSIFLDEIGNTTANFQIKLLKAVENKRFRRIGGTEEIEVSTRIIAATNVDLFEAVKIGKFREDLYYRLNVFQIRVPPLRKREMDTLIIARHFIEHFNREYHRKIKGLAPSAEKLIADYPWPGNVRQLKNAIERAVLVESEEWIEAEDLSLDFERDQTKYIPKMKIKKEEELPQEKMVAAVENNDGHHDSQNGTALPRFNKIEIPEEGVALEDFERNIILSAIERANGNLSHAARLLKINRGKLRYRLERLGITPQEIYSIKASSFSNSD